MTRRMKQPGVNARGDIVVHTPPPRVMVAGGIAGTALAMMLLMLAA
jgi:hypothetical protein